MSRLLIVVIAALFSACATTDLATLESQIKPVLKEGMPFSEAIAAMSSIGFSCSEGFWNTNIKNDVFECTRDQKGFLLPFGCIHRVRFAASSSKPFISNIDIWSPSCASM